MWISFSNGYDLDYRDQVPQTVRAAVVSDADAITRVRAASWRAGYRGLLPEATLAAMPETASTMLRERLAAPLPHCAWYVAERAGAVIGFVNLGPYRLDQNASRPAPEQGGEVRAIYVDPDHWGHGVGGELMTVALGRLRDVGLMPIRLWALRDNVRADRFYSRVGFVRDGRWAWFHCEDGSALMEMRYVLD